MANQTAGRNAAAPTTKSENPLDELVKNINQQRRYPGTQQNLYTYSKLGWENYAENLPDFTNYSEFYTAELGVNAIKFIKETEELPSFEALQAGHSVERDKLIGINSTVLGNWQVLADFINKTFGLSERPSMLKAAGHDYYSESSNYSWDKTAKLINMANTFIKANTERLRTDNIMPDGFPKQFKDAGEAFTVQRSVFLAKEREAKQGILDKSAANDAVYAALSDMFKSAARIYRNDKVTLQQFTVTRLMKEVRGNSPSGIKGRIQDSAGQYLANVLVSDSNDPSRSVLSDADGRYELKHPSGMMSVSVSLDGFVPVELERKISVGTMHRQNFVLNPVPVPVQVSEEEAA